MTLEELKSMGMSEEDAKKVIANMEEEQKAAVNDAVNSATKGLPTKEELKALRDKAKIADSFTNADLPDAESAAKIIADAKQAKADYEELTRKNKIETNQLKARTELEKVGVPEEKIVDILSCVTEDFESSMKVINAFTGSFDSVREKVEKEIRGNDLGSGQGSGNGQGNPGGEEKTEQEKLAENLYKDNQSQETSSCDILAKYE